MNNKYDLIYINVVNRNIKNYNKYTNTMKHNNKNTKKMEKI